MRVVVSGSSFGAGRVILKPEDIKTDGHKVIADASKLNNGHSPRNHQKHINILFQILKVYSIK